jgi:hypothetical protein
VSVHDAPGVAVRAAHPRHLVRGRRVEFDRRITTFMCICLCRNTTRIDPAEVCGRCYGSPRGER